MAGGMNTMRSSHGTLYERIHGVPPEPPTPTPGIKHCWVNNHHGRLPALLLEWRKVAAGFQGRVIRPVYEDEGWSIVEEWLPAALLEPAVGYPADASGVADSHTRSKDAR